ncbi:copper resistance D family protein [Arthrobacter pigmenti]
MLLWRAPAADPPAGRPLLTGAGIAGLSAFVLFAALAFTGAAEPPAIGDPGAFIRWALPSATLIHHTAMSITVASGLFLAGILPTRSPLFQRAAEIGAIAACTWAFSAAMVLLLGFADIVGQPLSASPGFLQQLGLYASSVTSGRARLAVLLAAVVVAGLLVALPTRRGGACAAAVGVAAVLPLSLIGHATSSELRIAAVTSLALHVGGVAVWVGGVIVLGLLAGMLKPTHSPQVVPVDVFRRFSTLAGVAFAVVFVSGILNSVIRLGDFSSLLTPYGSLIVVKTAATLGLGVIGYLHRRWISRPRAGGAPPYAAWRLIGGEILIMTGTMAVAVALAASDPGMGAMPGMDMGTHP